MADLAFLLQELEGIQTAHYAAAAAGALVIYDQVLTFSREVDHILNRQWSFTTALYLIARYSGGLQLIANTTSYICINWTISVNANIFFVLTWAQTVFMLTMQAILVIRVYALFNRSKKVLIFIATFYALQATAIFAMTASMVNKQTLHDFFISVGPPIGSVAQSFTLNNPPEYLTIGQATTYLAVAFDTILLFFALWAFVRHALEAKRLHRGWPINVLVRTMMADHLIYFVCFQAWTILNICSLLHN
ncbi:hypothetical protein BJ138DRAFT_1131023 [Hygrophoropsis aurantiaca]|uniref:Uncharacterized protein n=1 Tax=Hygrophoropsis aurantiaca TaxID=72124 RepID=A0ACB7ZT12_9AGAM|nr:hypothetical protein BJ138DRAFT_1131023 [Hygrophoropsis aurantiaca]